MVKKALERPVVLALQGHRSFMVMLNRAPSWLNLEAPITTAADDIFCYIFPNFQKKIRYDISQDSSADNSHKICLIC